MKLHRVVSCTQDQLELQNLLERVERWGAINDMNLNPSKSQHMVYTRAQRVKHFNYSIGDTVLHQVNTVRDLGVILDTKLNMTKHIDTVISKARATLGLVKFLSRGFDNSRATKTLYCALARSLLEYAAPVWSPVAACHINRLESTQKQFVLFALGRQRIGDSYVLPPYRERAATLHSEPYHRRPGRFCVAVRSAVNL